MGAIELAHPDPYTALLTPNHVVEKSPFQISANQLEVVENVNQTYLRIRCVDWLRSDEQSYSFRLSPKWVNIICVVVDITIMVMTLYFQPQVIEA